MEKSEQRELTLQIEAKIREYEGPNEDGVVMGLMWTLYLIKYGKDYADQHVKIGMPLDRLPRDCGC